MREVILDSGRKELLPSLSCCACFLAPSIVSASASTGCSSHAHCGSTGLSSEALYNGEEQEISVIALECGDGTQVMAYHWHSVMAH